MLIHEVPLQQDVMVSVWCAVNAAWTIGPFFSIFAETLMLCNSICIRAHFLTSDLHSSRLLLDV